MLHKSLTPTLPHEFNFAGFSWPRMVAVLPTGALTKRIASRRLQPVTGPYYHAPKPDCAKGIGFYLDSVGQPAERWEWADVSHSGWYCDRDCAQKIRGIVFRLPHGRFLAGWSMGEHMASSVSGVVYDDFDDATHAADEEARCAAEEQIEYQESEDQEFFDS